MSVDRFWLHDSGLVPAGAQAYECPPPIPVDQLRAELREGWTAERVWHDERDDCRGMRIVSTTVVRSPDDERPEFFP